MKLIVWIPGIMGTKLARRTGARIWPPHPEAEGGLSERTGAQLTADLVHGGIIDEVCVCEVYEPLDRLFRRAGVLDIDEAGGGASMARLPFGFDWRLSIEKEADRLADVLDAIDAEEVVFVGHSMGALFTRFLLEARRFHERPFRDRVTLFLSINGPHGGAATMVAKAIGLTKTAHIRFADQRAMLGTAPFSGAYQLMPSPREEDVMFDGERPVDFFDPAVAAHFGMGLENTAAAAAFRTTLAAGSKPAGCRYVAVASLVGAPGEASVIARLRHVEGAWRIEEEPGDGTVTHDSARALNFNDVAVMPGEHLGVITTTAFERLFLSEVLPERRELVESAAMALDEPEPEPMQLQPLESEVAAGAVLSVAVLKPASRRGAARLVWQRIDGAEARAARDIRVTRASRRVEEVEAAEGAAPVLRILAPDEPGLYRLTLVSPLARGGRDASVIRVVPATRSPPEALSPP